MMINPQNKTLGLLYKSDAILSVPKYQRSFDWGKSEVIEMMSDLKSAMDDKSSLFLGTIVFNTKDKNKYEIVDGQQRITSFTLLLIACRQQAYALNENSLATVIQQKISFTSDTTGKMISERVLVSSRISDVFKYISNESWDGVFPEKINKKGVKLQSNKLKPLYSFMFDEIKDFSVDELASFLDAIYSTYVIQIDIKDEHEAFDIFERTNARGLSLNVADLLKNFLYSKADKQDEIDEKWGLIVGLAGSTLQRMLKYFWVSKFGYISKKNLYRSLRDYGKKIGANNVIDELLSFAEYYSAIRSDNIDEIEKWLNKAGCIEVASKKYYFEQLASSLMGLNHFKITQHYPLVYAITKSYLNIDGEKPKKNRTKKYLNVIKNLENYHFINNQICERVGNEIEKPYADYSRDFSAEDADFMSMSNELTSLLKSKCASEEEFVSRFIELDYENLALSDTCYIFDRINNQGLGETEKIVKLFDPDKKLVSKNYNTEHFLPQNPKYEISEEDMEYVHNIGNLFILPIQTNSKVDNLDPTKKLKVLEKNTKGLRYIQDFIEEFKKTDMSWGKDEIIERGAELAKISYNSVWLIR